MLRCLFVFLAPPILFVFFFFFNDTATTEIYTLSLHDALPISPEAGGHAVHRVPAGDRGFDHPAGAVDGSEGMRRSEEHTSELQSSCNLVCRLLLEKKKKETHRLKSSRPTRATPSITRQPDAQA